MTAPTAPESQGLGVVLGAVCGGDRGGAAGDRDRPELAVGLGCEERRDRGRLGGDRDEVSFGAPARERKPVALIRPPGRRCERRLGVALGACELVGGDGQRWWRDAGWEVPVGHVQLAG